MGVARQHPDYPGGLMTTAFFGSEGQLMVPGVAGFDGIGQLQTIVSSSESEPGAFTGSGGLAAIVTEPYPAPGEFPDFEHVMVDWFTPITYTCQKWPPTIEALQALIPFIFARKIDGSTDINGITERAHCKIVAVGHDRGQSQQIAKQVRNALRACADDGGATVNGV